MILLQTNDAFVGAALLFFYLNTSSISSL